GSRTQHRYERRGTYVTRVRARVGDGRVVESVAQEVVITGSVPIVLSLLIAAALGGVGVGGFVYRGWRQFLKFGRGVPRIDAGEQRGVIEGRRSAREDARLRMVWPRGQQLVEWAEGHAPRKAEGHD